MTFDHTDPIRRVSVVITTRDRAQYLRDTLRLLSHQKTGGFDFEVVVADNGSVDETQAIVREASAWLPVRSVVEPTPGVNHARNRGIGAVDGDLVVFTDDDVLPADDWLAQYVDGAGRWPRHVVFGGPIELRYPDDTPAWVRELRWVNFPFVSDREAEGVTEGRLLGPNFAVRRTVLDGRRFSTAVGPDGTRTFAMGSETEFLLRLKADGVEFVRLPQARVVHRIGPEQLTEAALLARAFRLGRGHVRVERWHRYATAYIGGAPRYLWRWAAGALLRRAWAQWQGHPKRLQSQLELAYVRGCFHENWALRRQGEH